MANKLMRGLGKLAKGIGYTIAAILAATVISGLLVSPLGAAGAGWVFLGLLGAGTVTAVNTARGKTKAKKARQRDSDLASFAAAEEDFASVWKADLENRFADPAQRQAFNEQQLALQDSRRKEADKQRKKEAAEIKRQEERRLAQQREQAASGSRRGGSGYGGGGDLSDRFQSAAGLGGGQSAYDSSKAADDQRRRDEDERQQREQIIKMMSPNR